MIVIIWIDPDFVIVDVLGSLAQPSQRAATIIGDHQENVHHVDPIDVLRIGDDVRVVHGAGVEFVALFPTAAAVARAKDAAFAIA